MCVHKVFTVIIIGVQDYICEVDARDIPQVENYAEAPDPPASLEFLQLAQLIMDANSLQMPRSIEQAIDLYVTLTCTIEAYIH